MTQTADQFRAQAQTLATQGDVAGALTVITQGIAAHPGNAPLANSAGNFAMKAGEPAVAAQHFAKAAKLLPGNIEFSINHAIALSACGRHRDAITVLSSAEEGAAADPRYCSVRGNAARGAGDLAQAAIWYDKSLALAPTGGRAIHGRARIAMERGEAGSAARFEKAVAANSQDPEAWLGWAEALEADGQIEKARSLAQQLVQQAPQWTAALRALSKIRLAAGETDFASHFAEAAAAAPQDPAIVIEHIRVLDTHDRHEEASQIAADARSRLPDDKMLALLEAAQAGNAGGLARAEIIFAQLQYDTPTAKLYEARHRIRMQQYELSENLLQSALKAEPDNIALWATLDMVWRLTGNERSNWLHGQQGLVQMVDLPDGEDVLAQCVPLLHSLHDAAALPLGQSLRGGTQTRANLFQRIEPEFARLQSHIMQALEIYRSGLPDEDDGHPLLRHRDAPWAITGSWSVRLAGGGDHHAAHIHPSGILSSALYCELPDEVGDEGDRAGWIELGRPAPNMQLDMKPLYTLQPRRAALALFPSTLYHGTRPFTDGQRMTVAFDVTLGDGQS